MHCVLVSLQRPPISFCTSPLLYGVVIPTDPHVLKYLRSSIVPLKLNAVVPKNPYTGHTLFFQSLHSSSTTRTKDDAAPVSFPQVCAVLTPLLQMFVEFPPSFYQLLCVCSLPNYHAVLTSSCPWSWSYQTVPTNCQAISTKFQHEWLSYRCCKPLHDLYIACTCVHARH